MNELVNQLHGVLSTVRSHQLEHIKIETTVHLGLVVVLECLASAAERLASALERTDLRALHEAISQLHFDALKDVDVKMQMWSSRSHTKADVEDGWLKSEAMFRSILRPWSDRSIIKRFTSHC